MAEKEGLYFVLEEFGSRYYLGNDPDYVQEILNSGGILWDFQFGAVGTIHVLIWDVWNEGLEGSLEAAAEWLAENAPGHLVSNEELQELFDEAEAEGLDEDEAIEQATADLTYTEAGHLTSYEWWVNEIHVPKHGKGLTGNDKKIFWRAVALSFEEESDYLDEDERDELAEIFQAHGPSYGEIESSLRRG